MDDNRRTSFRSNHIAAREATLIVGRRQIRVRVLDESAGGMCVGAERNPGLPVDAEARLVTDDGLETQVQIKHCEQRGMNVRIGLQRTESSVRGGRRGKRSMPGERRSLRPATIIVALVLGFFLGAAVLSPPIQSRLSKIPGFSHAE